MKSRVLIKTVIGVLLVAGVGAAALWWYYTISNPHSYATIGAIPPPVGFERVAEGPYSQATWLRKLPLKPRGAKVMLYTGREARLQWLSAAVVDIPVLSNYEQCADMTMRLRAEWLYDSGRYGKICFRDVNGKMQQYTGGSHKALERYLRRIYGCCSTFSVYHETQVRPLADVRPGDVLVYYARYGHTLGHAVMVADVAVNKKTGQRAIMCVEGNTPARECHIVRNLNPLRNPWFILDGNEGHIFVSVFYFSADELRHY